MTSSSPAAIGSGRPGRIRKALNELLADPEVSARMRPHHAVLVELARNHAALVDRAARAGDGRGMVQAAGQLQDLMAALPLVPIRESGEGVTGDGNSGGTVLDLFSAGPSGAAVGDGADA